MTGRTYNIHFYPCPTQKHHGETWLKLQKMNTRELAQLIDIQFVFSDKIPLEVICADTFPDFTAADWLEFLKIKYGGHIFGMLLFFEHPSGNFTTFRPYSVRNHRSYEYALDNKVPYRVVVKYSKENNHRI